MGKELKEEKEKAKEEKAKLYEQFYELVAEQEQLTQVFNRNVKQARKISMRLEELKTT